MQIYTFLSDFHSAHHTKQQSRDFSRLCSICFRSYFFFFFDFFFLSDLLGAFFHLSVSDFNAYFSRAESVLLLFIRLITYFFSNGVFALLISIVICSYSDNIESCANDIVSMFFTSTESNDCAETIDVKQVVITANNILLIRFVFIIKKPRNIRGFPYLLL